MALLITGLCFVTWFHLLSFLVRFQQHWQCISDPLVMCLMTENRSMFSTIWRKEISLVTISGWSIKQMMWSWWKLTDWTNWTLGKKIQILTNSIWVIRPRPGDQRDLLLLLGQQDQSESWTASWWLRSMDRGSWKRAANQDTHTTHHLHTQVTHNHMMTGDDGSWACLWWRTRYFPGHAYPTERCLLIE